MREHEYWMNIALEEAKKAFDSDEVPVGAIAVFEERVVAKAHNSVEALHDASAHAEMLCLRQAAFILKRWRLHGVTLYTTLEPCAMCMGALFSFRIDRLIWGAPDLRMGADGSWISLVDAKHPIHQFEVVRNVLRLESSCLMKEFFKKKRL